MTRWGLILLILFIVLGLSRTSSDKAVRIAVWATFVVIATVGIKVGAL